MTRLADVAHALPERAPGATVPEGPPTGWSLSPRRKKAVLAAHIVVSVGLLGIYAAMLLLGAVAATTPDPETSSAAYRSMGVLRGTVPPGAVGVLATGVVLALGTSWGLFKHRWVVVKLALTLAALPVSILVVFPAVRQAIDATSRAAPLAVPDSGGAPLVLIAASGAIVLMLGAATVIAVYKPWGTIARGRRDTARHRLPDAAPPGAHRVR